MQNNEQLEKNLTLARRAREEGNAADAKRFYDLVRNEDINNIEARFYYSYYNMLSGTKGNALSATKQLFKVTDSILESFSQAEKTNEEVLKELTFCGEIFTPISSSIDIIFNTAQSIGGDNIDGVRDTIRYSYSFADKIHEIFSENEKGIELSVLAWKNVLLKQANLGNGYYSFIVAELKPEFDEYTAKIQKYDPSFVAPTVKAYEKKENKQTAQGCSSFIASIFGGFKNKK